MAPPDAVGAEPRVVLARQAVQAGALRVERAVAGPVAWREKRVNELHVETFPQASLLIA